jgi:adenosylcobinamide kinase/adenosylcobinamide-phosphate guanylyltransferase
MKILYYGGQKSGKSRLAEQKAHSLAKAQKPYYIATYDNSYGDSEMDERIRRHRIQREEAFITLEEPRELSRHIREGETYLIDCMSMWLLNRLNDTEASLMAELERLADKEAHIIFVLNDVSAGVIPSDAMSRRYVDLSGIIGQRLAAFCDEVYEVKLGLEMRLK